MTHSRACERSRVPKSKCLCSCAGTFHGIANSGEAQTGASSVVPASMPQLSASEDAQWGRLLSATAELQQILPEAILVGGTAAALYAGHRVSFDADHVLSDLRERFDAVLARLEREAGWKTRRRTAPVLILGSFHGVEQGVRQLMRKRPLQTTAITVGSHQLVIPTVEEISRIKGILLVRRNAVRDYLDVAALTKTMGEERAAQALSELDAFYETEDGEDERPVVTQLVKQLAEPRPVDVSAMTLQNFRGLDPAFSSWDVVKVLTRSLAVEITNLIANDGRG